MSSSKKEELYSSSSTQKKLSINHHPFRVCHDAYDLYLADHAYGSRRAPFYNACRPYHIDLCHPSRPLENNSTGDGDIVYDNVNACAKDLYH